jgi:hypothetical protein
VKQNLLIQVAKNFRITDKRHHVFAKKGILVNVDTSVSDKQNRVKFVKPFLRGKVANVTS